MDGEHLVGFGSDGVHYVLDGEGHLDKSQPLTWENGGWVPRKEGDPLHNEVHHQNTVDLWPGEEPENVGQ